MPELPEVETVLRGLAPTLVGQTIAAVTVRQPALRIPVPAILSQLLPGQTVAAISRRGKYLIFQLDSGWLICHLGMSGSLRIVPRDTPATVHDHVDLALQDHLLRYRDPRRFGLIAWTTQDPLAHPLLASLGPEPLSDAFDGAVLHKLVNPCRSPIKTVLMDSHRVVGVGNIYASESLFRAGIHPATVSRDLTRRRCKHLADAIRATLTEAIAAGGSSLRDFVHSDGNLGYFQQHYFVYGRTGEACRVCGTPIQRSVMAQRATYFCPACQPLAGADRPVEDSGKR